MPGDKRRGGVEGGGGGVTFPTFILSGGMGGATGTGTGCIARANALAKALTVGYRSPGFFASTRPTTASISGESVGLMVLGGVGQLLRCASLSCSMLP